MTEPTNKEIFELLVSLEKKVDSLEGRSMSLEGKSVSLEEHLIAFEEKNETNFREIGVEMREFQEETRENFKEIKVDIRELQGMTIPLNEQTEILKKVRRIEDHLNLPHELKTT